MAGIEDTPTSARSFVKDFITEGRRYRREAWRFLRLEVDCGKTMCRIRAAQDKHPYYCQLESQLELLDMALKNLEAHLDAVLPMDPEKRWSPDHINNAFAICLSWYDFSVSLLSEILQDMANAFAQRRFRGGTSESLLQVQVPRRRVRLSEVHLDYPDTFRAVTAVIADYFNRFRERYLPDGQYDHVTPPVVAVARGANFSLEYFCPSPHVPVFIRDNQTPKIFDYIGKSDDSSLHELDQDEFMIAPEVIRSYAVYLVSFSRVVAPRYFPEMVRYSPLLAHELFHPLIRIAQLIKTNRKDLKPGFLDDFVDSQKYPAEQNSGTVGEQETADSGDSEAIGLRVIRHYGRSMACLVNDLVNVENSLLDVLPVLYPGPIDNIRKATLKKMAQSFAAEFIADLGGFTIAHESYLFALACNGYIDGQTTGNATEIKKGLIYLDDPVSHPPMIVRVRLLMEIAREMGFNECVAELNKLIQEFNASTPAGGLYEEIWDQWCTVWWRAYSTRKIILRLMNGLYGSTKMTSLYHACECGTGTARLPRFSEDRLRNAFKIIIDRVDNDLVFWDDRKSLGMDIAKAISCPFSDDFELSISDVFNALWYDMMATRKRSLSWKRLQWRFALSKNFGGLHV